MPAPPRALRVRFLASYPDAPPPPTLPEVAFAGRSNVGKSSALNRLFGVAGLARVSKTPGRTQALNYFEVDGRWLAVDLPGYGHARVSHGVRDAWKGLIEGYLGDRPTLRLVVALVDARIPAQESDTRLVHGLLDAGIHTAVVATKIDGITKGQRARALAALAEAHTLPPGALIAFSAVDGTGREEVLRLIEARIRAPA